MNNPTEKELLEQIKEAADQCAKLEAESPDLEKTNNQSAIFPYKITGGGSKDFYGANTRGAPLSTHGLLGILNYEPSELYITVKAGTTLAEVESVLAEQGQYLAFEAPNFNGLSTIGGAVASGLSGPSRASCGGVRDYVLGLKMINGKGQHLTFGGQVMKNVAGYDVSRLLSGSWGTLGLVTEVSLKVLPKALAEQTIVMNVGQQSAIDLLNEWGATSLPLNASVWQGLANQGASGQLWIRLRGAVAAVNSGEQRIFNQCKNRGTSVQILQNSVAEKFWDGHKNQTLEFYTFAPSATDCLWRLSVPQKTPELVIKSVDPFKPQCLEWNAGLRWIWAPSGSSEYIKASAQEAGGHATLWRVSEGNAQMDKEVGVFTPLSLVQRKIQRSLQREFDPWGLFNTGRLEI